MYSSTSRTATLQHDDASRWDDWARYVLFYFLFTNVCLYYRYIIYSLMSCMATQPHITTG